VRLPFSKKGGSSKGAPEQSAPAKAPRRRSSKGVPESALARPRRQGNHWANQWQHPQAPPDLPGICGYLNGVKEHERGYHPSRFVYVRPDGQPDAAKYDHVTPSVASTRPVPKGFLHC
jgi:hypothetical protein